ncbi:unnamed protein product [Boreogadus saida]
MKEDVCLYSTALFNTLGPKFAMDANEVVHAGGFKVQTQTVQRRPLRLLRNDRGEDNTAITSTAEDHRVLGLHAWWQTRGGEGEGVSGPPNYTLRTGGAFPSAEPVLGSLSCLTGTLCACVPLRHVAHLPLSLGLNEPGSNPLPRPRLGPFTENRYGDCVAASVYYVYVVKGQQLLSRVNKEKMESNRSERRKGALKLKADGGHGQRTLLGDRIKH